MRGGMRSAYARACAVKLCCTATLLALLAPAAQGVDSTTASTSEAARNEARRGVPLAKVDPAYRSAVAAVLADPTLFRRLPTSVVDCRPEMFTFLAQNPEALVEIWRHLGVSRVELIRIDDQTCQISDGAGTTGRVVVVEQTCEAGAQNRIVMYVEGSYEGKPFPRPITAQCVLVLTSGSKDETNGRRYVAARLDAFVKFDQRSLELAAKAIHPFVGQTVDRNFLDTMLFVSNLSFAAENRPESIEQMAVELENLNQPRRQGLTSAAYQCAEAGRQWRASRALQASAEISAP